MFCYNEYLSFLDARDFLSACFYVYQGLYELALFAPDEGNSQDYRHNNTAMSRASGRSLPGTESMVNEKCFGVQTHCYVCQMDSGPIYYVSLRHNL